MISHIKDKIRVATRRDALKLHMLIKSFEKNYNLSTSDIDTLIELSEVGYSQIFFDNCVSKGYYKSEQTVRNAITKMTKLGILSYENRGERNINRDLMPDITSEKLIMEYLVGNL